ncbi:MAG: polymer-forming cytoskeletal protein [Firmicutes bacterium]|nr:polymer-forming cytoskeletal protein [Bacillota bacterium]
MNSKENFVQAIRELTGFNDGTFNEEKTISQDAEAAGYGEGQERSIYPVRFSTENKTHISAGMAVKGMIQSKSNVLVEGSVQGDIHSENVLLRGAEVKGNLHISSKADICENTKIVGNIFAENIVVSGRIKGNLQIGDTTALKPGGYVEGDIKTGSIISEYGSGIRGAVSTEHSCICDDVKFDLGGAINE